MPKDLRTFIDQVARDMPHEIQTVSREVDPCWGATAVAARLDRPILVLTYQQEQAQRLWDDLVRFGVPQERVCTLPSSQSLFLEGDITDFRAIGERIGALMSLAQGEPCIVIGTAEAVL